MLPDIDLLLSGVFTEYEVSVMADRAETQHVEEEL